jgi:hypothetical protein
MVRIIPSHGGIRSAGRSEPTLARVRETLQDHTGRRVVYTYDDGGYLDQVSGPNLPGEIPGRAEYYEYDQVGNGYKLARVRAWDGQLLVENEYERDPLSDFFGYVTRQTENQRETSFFYEKITDEPTRRCRRARSPCCGCGKAAGTGTRSSTFSTGSATSSRCGRSSLTVARFSSACRCTGTTLMAMSPTHSTPRGY